MVSTGRSFNCSSPQAIDTGITLEKATNYTLHEAIEVGKKNVLSFTLIFGVGSLASHLLMILTSSFQQFAYPLTATNIIGQLSFQLLLSGPSEELIFRAVCNYNVGTCYKR